MRFGFQLDQLAPEPFQITVPIALHHTDRLAHPSHSRRQYLYANFIGPTLSYDPADLLKLYLYGYLHRIRSSRLPEAECQRNVEVIWLLGKLTPDFKTIADFRKDNLKPLRAVNRQFTVLCRKLELFGGQLLAVDGSKFQAVNARDQNFNAAKLQDLIERADARLAEYLQQLDASNEAEPAADALDKTQ